MVTESEMHAIARMQASCGTFTVGRYASPKGTCRDSGSNLNNLEGEVVGKKSVTSPLEDGVIIFEPFEDPTTKEPLARPIKYKK